MDYGLGKIYKSAGFSHGRKYILFFLSSIAVIGALLWILKTDPTIFLGFPHIHGSDLSALSILKYLTEPYAIYTEFKRNDIAEKNTFDMISSTVFGHIRYIGGLSSWLPDFSRQSEVCPFERRHAGEVSVLGVLTRGQQHAGTNFSDRQQQICPGLRSCQVR